MSRPSSCSAVRGCMPATGSLTTSWKNSGTIWVRPPMLTARIMNRASRPTFFSTTSCCFISVRYLTDLRCGLELGRFGDTHGAPGVVGHQQHAGDEEGAAQSADHEARMAGFQRFDERVGQGAVLVDRTPHQALGDAVDPHRG